MHETPIYVVLDSTLKAQVEEKLKIVGFTDLPVTTVRQLTTYFNRNCTFVFY
jgi:hypothetical protein